MAVPEHSSDTGVHTDTDGPFHYRFRATGSSKVILLDRPAYVGRAPSLPRIRSGTPPRLVRVPSPSGEISSSHLELRQVGSTVVVTDLRSTNGSWVRVPGQPPTSLRHGESMTLSPGAIIDLGDGVELEVLPLQRTT